MCAHQLRQIGYQPIIFEALPIAGGMLAVGIPEFRLPKAVLNAEINRLERYGIEIKLNTPVGGELTIDELRQKYAAVFIGIGAHVERRLGIPGEDLQGVWGGVDFLRRVNLGEDIRMGKRVLVIGGGNSALDAARTALRCGAKDVTIVYRRTRDEMPAESHEIEEAESEGVKIRFLAAPKSVLDKEKEKELVCQNMKLGEPDSSGRRRPVPIEGSEIGLPCDEIIVTIGQTPDHTGLGEKLGLDMTRWETFSADPLTLETNIPGVFVGGDCVTGPDVVVNAMYAGKKAAISIDRFIRKEDMRSERKLEEPYKSAFEVDTSGEPVKKRIDMPAISMDSRNSFEEVYSGYTKDMAKEEAARCLECAVCCDCRNCFQVCEPHAIDYFMKDKIVEMQVGSIILATGFQTFDAKKIPQYGYGRYPNVYTGLEVERLLNTSGPTKGEIILRDGQKPKTVGIIHCVGSGDKETDHWSSRVSNMYSLKLAHLIEEHSDASVFNFNNGNGESGKEYGDFYDRLLKEGVQFIQSRVEEVTDDAEIPEEEGKLVIRVEDTQTGVDKRIPVDMVILAVGLEPKGDAQEVGRMFNISSSSGGFFLEQHPKPVPSNTFTDGIFIAGCCQGPKDIPDTITQADAAAAEVLSLIESGNVEV
jgi:heterodisulfide reductase subunit A